MQVGDIGVTLIVLPNAPGTTNVNILGTNSILVVNSPSTINYRAVFDLVIADDGLSGSYITQPGDFPVDGIYLCQLVSVFPSGQILYGTVTQLEVDPSLLINQVTPPPPPYPRTTPMFRGWIDDNPNDIDTYDLYDIIGDFYYNSTPAPGLPSGWQCIQTGTPGVWRSLGIVGDT